MSTKNREYFSEARRAGAESTKQRILGAAKELFSREGFEKTTIGGVAELAEVSAASIYALYKSKEGLLRALMHSISFGAEFQTLINKALTNPDPIECLRMVAGIARTVYEAEKAEMEFFRGAAVLSPNLKNFEKETENLRYKGQEAVVRRLFDEKVVSAEISVAEARDILWSLTSRDIFRMLVIERKWSAKKYEKWLADTLTKSLIREIANAPGRRTK